MRFNLISDESRKLALRMDLVDIYTQRWKPGTPFDLEIVRRTPHRSAGMRAYYFAAVLPPFMEELGYDPDEQELFHRQLKITFFQIRPDKRGIYRGVPSVFSNESDMPVPDKVKFVEWVIRKAAQNGVYIEPSEGEHEHKTARVGSIAQREVCPRRLSNRAGGPSSEGS